MTKKVQYVVCIGEHEKNMPVRVEADDDSIHLTQGDQRIYIRDHVMKAEIIAALTDAPWPEKW